MPEPADWSTASFDGNRRAQHAAFRALTFREKLVRLEQMSEVQARLIGAVRSGPRASPLTAPPGVHPPRRRTS
jgi:hypothetical protein